MRGSLQRHCLCERGVRSVAPIACQCCVAHTHRCTCSTPVALVARAPPSAWRRLLSCLDLSRSAPGSVVSSSRADRLLLLLLLLLPPHQYSRGKADLKTDWVCFPKAETSMTEGLALLWVVGGWVLGVVDGQMGAVQGEGAARSGLSLRSLAALPPLPFTHGAIRRNELARPPLPNLAGPGDRGKGKGRIEHRGRQVATRPSRCWMEHTRLDGRRPSVISAISYCTQSETSVRPRCNKLERKLSCKRLPLIMERRGCGAMHALLSTLAHLASL